MERDLIVFGEDWGGLPSSTQHLIRCLSRDRKILWVNSIGLRKPKLNLRDVKRVCNKLGRFIGVIREVKICDDKLDPNHFRVVNPIALPVPESRIAREVCAWLLAKQIKPVMDSMSLYKPVLWTSLPTISELKGALGNIPAVYYCGDDFSALAGVDHRTVALHEERLVKNSDLIFAASAHLESKFPSKKTKLLTHGVDVDLFAQPTVRAADLPDNGKPIAGFYGSLSEWIDRDLLFNVVAENAHWNFVFIGQEQVDFSVIKGLSNAYFLGPKAHAELPGYSQHWNASILPFLLNDQIKACNPLKLKEYLAVGKPVISTDFPSAQGFRPWVDVATDGNDFSRLLNLSLHNTAERSRRASVTNETWDAKADLIRHWVASL